ncbi:cysteine desulfurase, sulfur acceptor subunit CsdE [Psychrosphaera saromensis]|uniref:Fe-S metabolism associated domain-containing protein n=1 Tax=Psychrosphaera saromensis TaxID=716813 RepID=A0A2S7UWD2_9GAMM|nr:SufE family protein [Psychrosphaera saromensis]PQJ54079.1 hypothetical protein BTO11_10730 [Psychrosphaera saromensis]GHB76652.1 cysteine desulfurase, sulfur acceptor subunit CsdE [Psychrosphaera saromensis]GLQ14423.1 cysteine desulfurase, sulfur acceptor subunit CsdE [Psychrosphaera saromensis]
MPTDQQAVTQLSSQFTLTDIQVTDVFKQQNSWEDKFRQLMLLGKKLPQLPIEYQLEQHLVSGCESKVWLLHEWNNDKLCLIASSDAKIVKGLISVVLAAFNNKTQAQIQAFDLESYLAQLNLLNQLSPSRANGLRAIIDKINQYSR